MSSRATTPVPSRASGRGATVTAKTPCEHRRIEKRGGKTYCRDCKPQIYL